MTDLMNRSFTRREKGMILVLLVVLVVGLYFLAVHYPITNRMEQIEREEEETEALAAAAEAKYAEYAAMKQELEEILSQPEGEVTVMPPYNNIKTLMRKLDVIFAGTGADFQFGQAGIADGVAARRISFTCTARDYPQARALIREVEGTGYRCLLESFTLTPVGGNLYEGELSVSGVVTFYEYVRQDEEAGEE